MASFPTSVAGDSQLYVAANNKATALTSGIDNSTLTIPVSSTTGFPSDGFITIGSEIIHYTSVGANQFNADLRGADGSTAASHLSADAVSHYIVAAHHNVLKEEVKAIETALGVNLANVVQITGTQTISGDKIFSSTVGVVLRPNGSSDSLDIQGQTAGTLAIRIAPNGATSNSAKIIGTLNGSDTNMTLRVGGLDQVQITPTSVSIKGTNTNDSAASGYVGEYVESASTSTVNHVNSQYTNYVSISLTAGDWDITGILQHRSNSATGVSEFDTVISTNSGNTQTDHVLGKNLVYNLKTYSTTERETQTVPVYRLSLSATTTVYLKGLVSVTSGTPTMNAGCISARRVR